MYRKKNKFLTFIFALLPGAAEMYMGFMKMGLTLMSVFFGTIAAAVILDMPILMLLLAVIWFYSFFHATNLKGLDDEEFYAVEDDYLIHISDIVANKEHFIQSYRKVIAWVLILFGAAMIWRGFFNTIYWRIPYLMRDTVSVISRFVPRLVVGAGIIFMGIIMIRGKKKELEEEEKKNAENNEIENGYLTSGNDGEASKEN